VQAIGTAAGTTITIHGTPGVTLRADAIDRDALAALHEVCQSSGGLVWQAPDGTMHYGAADHRTTPTRTRIIPPSAIVDGVRWAENTDDIRNSITIKWDDGTGEQQRTFTDTDSIAEPWGRRHQDVTTLVADDGQAAVLGNLILARRAWPYWVMPSTMIHGDPLPLPDRWAVAALDVSSLVSLPIPDVPDATPVPTRVWVTEGWVQMWDESGEWVQLAVSDQARALQPTTWTEMAAQTWAHWATGTWNEQLSGLTGQPLDRRLVTSR